jgi:RNA-directed DNA polymerase
MIRRWLKAGVVEDGRFAPTEQGAPQGGVISPLLLNIVLHGMEQAAGVRYFKRSSGGIETAPDAPVLVRYADDLLAFCHSRQHAEQVRQRLAEWLRPRGLRFNEDKTRIVHVNQGCDFLGFNIRRYHGKLPLIKPSNDAVRQIRRRLRAEMRVLLGGNAGAVMRTLTPIIRGWAAYYRTQVSSEVFSALDDYMWKLLYKWAKRSHPNKSRWWRMDRYFGRFNTSRNNRWVFGDHDSGAYLPKFAWTKIVRHQMVAADASPDDPTLAQYWAGRRHRQPAAPLNALTLGLLKAQRGRCTLCGTCCCTPNANHSHPKSGSCGCAPPGWRFVNTTSPPATARTINASSTPPATAGPPARQDRHFCPQRRHDLLEPDEWKPFKSGSEGAPAQQCAGAT